MNSFFLIVSFFSYTDLFCVLILALLSDFPRLQSFYLSILKFLNSVPRIIRFKKLPRNEVTEISRSSEWNAGPLLLPVMAWLWRFPRRNEDRPHPFVLKRKHVCVESWGVGQKSGSSLLQLAIMERASLLDPPKAIPNTFSPFPFVDRYAFRPPEWKQAV